MQKSSMLFFLLLVSLALLGGYYATLEGQPAQILIRFMGVSAFLLLCVSLMIGPLFVFRPKEFAQLVEPRRAVGLSAFVFVLVHGLLVTALYFGWNIEIMLGFLPLQIGAAAAIILLVIAAVSNDFALARLGPWWKRIQQLNYIAFVLSMFHFLAQSGITTGARPTNIAEYALLALGALVIVMQVAGFIVRKGRSAKPAAKGS